MNFQQKLQKIVKRNKSLVCVGLDPDIKKFPKGLKKSPSSIFSFNKAIIDATNKLVCVYKLNIAFYEAYGLEGLKQFKKTIEYLKKKYPHIPIVLDGKRADIGNTSKMYAKAFFEYWGGDALTVYPHLGLDSLEPFFRYKDKLVILLIRTSNPDAKMFQDVMVGKHPYYIEIARQIKEWPYPNIGIFVGATYPHELKQIRKIFPDKIFLSAGIGVQAASIKQAIQAGRDKKGENIMYNASRSIIYASSGKDFAERAAEETEKLRDSMNKYRFEK